MADNDARPTGSERLRNIIGKIDRHEGATAPAGEPPAPAVSPYLPSSEKQVVSVSSKLGPPAKPGEAAADKRPGFSLWEAFKNIAIIFSFVVNLILVGAVIGLLVFMFDLKRGVVEPLLGGLYHGFVAMDEAHIVATIPVNTTIPVNDKVTADFSLPLQQTTNVVLARDTLITGASVTIQGGILTLSNAPTTIVLPQGTVLPVILDLQVPVKQDIPVNLSIPVSIPVAVDIPLQQTELHRPFTDLRDLFAPYYLLVRGLPDSWGELAGGR